MMQCVPGSRMECDNIEVSMSQVQQSKAPGDLIHLILIQNDAAIEGVRVPNDGKVALLAT